MSDANQSPTPTQQVDYVLLSAWRRLMYYDRISYNEKQNFIQLRKTVILVTFFGSLASIAVMLLDFLLVSQEALSFLGMLALALPIVALAVMQYTARYAAPTTWIQYRYAAEKIRSNIYQYRTRSGMYNTEHHMRDDILHQTVLASEKIITNTVPLEQRRDRRKLAEEQAQKLSSPVDKTPYEQALAEIGPALRYSGGDDGFMLPLDIDQYMKTRVYQQRDWYRDRVQKDYVGAKRFTVASLIITATGSILGVILGSRQVQWVGLVAVANALSVSVNAWGNARMFGKTYGIYDRTARQLENVEGMWNAHRNNPDFIKDYTRYQNDFVQQVEAILMGELDSWYSIATETQLSNDEMLVTSIRNLQSDIDSPEEITEAMLNQLRGLPPQRRTQQMDVLRTEMAKLEDENPAPPPPPAPTPSPLPPDDTDGDKG